MSMDVQKPIQVPVFSYFGYIHQRGIAESYSNCLIFWRITVLFFVVAAPSYIPISSAQGWYINAILLDVDKFYVMYS